MVVVVWSRNSLEPRRIQGDLISLVNDMNIAAASGKQFVVVQKEDGAPVAIQTQNITTMDQEDESDAYIGR